MLVAGLHETRHGRPVAGEEAFIAGRHPQVVRDEDPGIRPMHNIYCASRATWYTDPASLPEYDELPPRKK